MPSPWSRFDALKDRAKLAREEDQLPLAIKLFQIYLGYRETDGYAWLALGDCQRIVGRLRAARRCLRQALRHAPAERRYLVEAHLATAYADWGHHRRAESFFRSAATENEQLEWIWLFRGRSYVAREKWRAAEACFSRAIELDRNAWEAYYELGIVLRATQKYQAARELFTSALERAPDSTAVQQALQSLVDHEQFANHEQSTNLAVADEAAFLKHWDRRHTVFVLEALQRSNRWRQSARSLLFVADALRSVNRSRESIRCYSDALRLDGHDAFLILTGLAMSFRAIGIHSRAEAFFAKAMLLPESRSSPYLWVLRGANLTKREKFRRANWCYRQAILVDSSYDEAYLSIGLNLLATGRYPAARRYLRKAQSLDDTQEVREAIARLKNAEQAPRIAQDILKEHL